MIRKLEREGKLSLSTRVSEVLPTTSRSPLGDISIGELLEMRSGLPHIKNWGVKVRTQIFGEHWSHAEITKHLLSYQLGEKEFQYSNVGYILLSVLIAAIENKSFEEVLNDRIFKPFKMDTTYLDVGNRENSHLPHGYFLLWGRYIPMPYWNYAFLKGAGGIVSHVDDLYRWHKGLMSYLEKDKEFEHELFQSEKKYAYGWSLLETGLISHDGETPGFCS